jgi:hypothetical protein
MSQIFVRERRHAGKGTGRPRFAVVGIVGTDLRILAPHLRKSELEALAAAIQSEVVYLPRGEHPGQSQEETGHGGRQRGWKRKQE